MINFDSDFLCWYFTRAIPLPCLGICRLQPGISFSSFWRSVSRSPVFSGLSDPILGATVDQLDLLGDLQPRDDPHRTRQKRPFSGLSSLQAAQTRRFPLDGPNLSSTLKTLVQKQLCVVCAKAQVAVVLFLPQSRGCAWCKVSSD